MTGEHQPIIEEIRNSHPPSAFALEEATKISASFNEFLTFNRHKINKKLSQANGLQFSLDVIAELNAAMLICFADPSMQIEYEPSILDSPKRPEFLIRKNGSLLYVEVKRLRDSPETTQVNEAFFEIERFLKGINSDLGFDLEMLELDLEPAIATELQNKIQRIKQEVLILLQKAKQGLSTEQELITTLESFPLLSVRFVKISQKSENTPTANLGGGRSILYRNNEHLKIVNRLSDAARKLPQAHAGIVFLQRDSETVEHHDLPLALHNIARGVETGNETLASANRFESIESMREALQNVCAVVMYDLNEIEVRKLSMYSNPLFDKQLDKEFFTRLGRLETQYPGFGPLPE